MKGLNGILFLASHGSDRRFDDLRLALSRNIPIGIVPNALSAEGLASLEAPVLPFLQRDHFIAVGSFHWLKGFDFVIRAYAASASRYLFPLHLFGQEFTVYAEKLRHLAIRLGLSSEQVVFHAGLSGSHLMECYSRARLFLCGSLTECQPLVLLDANASGTPFIARSSGCIDSMQGGVPVQSTLEMASQMDQLAPDASAWSRLSDAGRGAALARHHPARVSRLPLPGH
jgi:glycosyltransferase involved in cell wall biosynthesis